ncbi:hypothetical protein M9H77_31146 [Catharanthus roseus]|uniref:Uncharacterized protein n=1 Tax=Catharanthus roseus TaxID=4058 RepID=A0ACC0A036_CATRO|nr:hypothetical protein M9H77_31146 [Catharanthus roseus]
MQQSIERLVRDVEELKKGKSSASMDQRIGDNFGVVNSPHHQRPYDNMSTQGYHDMSAYYPYPFHEGQGGRGYYRPHEEVPRHKARHEDNLYEDYGDNSNVPSFKGESDPNVFLDWERQMENLCMVRNYSDIAKVKLVIVEFSGYALH